MEIIWKLYGNYMEIILILTFLSFYFFIFNLILYYINDTYLV